MKKNKNLIILLLIAIIGIVGVTIAYFSSRATFENVFETPEYGTTYIEKFTSPDNWLPGDITEKTLQVTNSGDVDEAVRVKVEESWVSKRGTTLPLTQGNDVAALINFINEDDWTKVTVDEEDYYYYYYNYKLSPEETTSKLLDKVTFNPLINAGTTCSDTVVDGVTTRTCNSNGEGYDGATYTLKLTVETVQYNKYQEAWNTDIAIAEEKPHLLTMQEFIESATNPRTITDYNDESADKGKMFYFTHTLNEGAEDEKIITETRYIGDEPNNYVYFNCDDMTNQSASTCEVWRIIGVFDVDDGTGNVEQRMKLVRGSDLATTRAYRLNYNNDWTGSSLKTFLNGDYYNRSGDAATYGLKATARGIIDEAKYYLGAVSSNNVSSNFGTTEKIYGEERGNTVCGACNSVTTKLTWTGSVGLMYPSDEYMVYGNGVNDHCYNEPYYCFNEDSSTGWIYKSNILEGQISSIATWFVSSRANNSSDVLLVGENGHLSSNPSGYNSFYLYGVRPVVYLKHDVKITDGYGTSENPYKLQ